MKVPHLILCKLADHVLPGFPGDVVWAVTLPANQVLHHSALDFAVEHIFQLVLIFLIPNGGNWRI